MTDRQRERLLHLERELSREQRSALIIERIPPTARTTEQLEMLDHHLRMVEVIREMLAHHQLPIK